MQQSQYSIDISELHRPLKSFSRGAIAAHELCGLAASKDYLSGQSAEPDVVDTAAELYDRVLDRGSFDRRLAKPAAENLGAETVMAVLQAVQYASRVNSKPPTEASNDGCFATKFRQHWADQIRDLAGTEVPDQRIRRIHAAGAYGLDRLLPTDVIVEMISDTSDFEEGELPHRIYLGKNLTRRFVDSGEHQRAIRFAADFTPRGHRLLFEVARCLPNQSSQWGALFDVIRSRQAAIAADGDRTAVLYAAAHAAACGRRSAALELLTLFHAGLAADASRSVPTKDHPERRIELAALTALIHHALGDNNEARRWAESCLELVTTSALEADCCDQEVSVFLPKAAGWILVAREPDAGNRIKLLQQAYDKYNVRVCCTIR